MRYTLVALLALFGSACALTGPSGGSKSYDTQTLTVAGVSADLLRAVHAMAVAEGWSVVSTNDSTGRLEAVSPVDSTLGVDMRERWSFAITDYEIAVTRVLEVRFSATEDWLREGSVCTGYVYLRERQVLTTLARTLTTGKSYAARSPLAPKERS